MNPDVVALLDAAVDRPVVVFGSLPPHGRDLDIVARPPEIDAMTDALAQAGFVNNGSSTWANLADGTAVELVPVTRWRLADDRLFDDAVPLDGCTHVSRPAPHHALLILARRLVHGGPLDDRRVARIEAALAEDPSAWDTAGNHAAAWRAAKALALLRTGAPPTTAARAAALADELGPARAWRHVLRGNRKRPGVVVAVSGVDGSGKTTQVESLIDTLQSLGVDTVRVWTRLSFNERLWKVARAGKRALAVVARRRGSNSLPADVDPSRLSDDGRRLRYDSRLLTFGWSTLVAFENGMAHRRETKPHLRAGRVVVCDRYLLDSAVHLRYRYGESREFRFQRWLVKVLSPPAAAAFYLEVQPATAVARKVDQYDVPQLERQVRLYGEECDRWDVQRLDGERPRDDLAADIAATVWAALRPSGRRRRLRR
jgi:thymidylate kinase